MTPQTPPGLYIHVPFCAAKCDYCAFYSEDKTLALMGPYTDALCLELQRIASPTPPQTIFFGGGTPSLLSLTHWKKIFAHLDSLGFLPVQEFTIECNPATVSADKAQLFRDHGVNRISMGVQSLNESLLERLGRIHTRDQVFRSYDILRNAGFANINLDLMFAIPGQTLAHWETTLQEILELQTEHLACYELIYEEDTVLYQQLAQGQIQPDEDLAAVQYETLIQTLQENGYHQYEIANFARHNTSTLPPHTLPHYACQHNTHYWQGRSYNALGPSASGYLNGTRFKNWSHLNTYIELVQAGKAPIESRDNLTPLQRAGEIAAFGLRMPLGWNLAEFQRLTGYSLLETWPDTIQTLVQNDHATLTSTHFALTPLGIRYADAAAEGFLELNVPTPQ